MGKLSTYYNQRCAVIYHSVFVYPFLAAISQRQHPECEDSRWKMEGLESWDWQSVSRRDSNECLWSHSGSLELQSESIHVALCLFRLFFTILQVVSQMDENYGERGFPSGCWYLPSYGSSWQHRGSVWLRCLRFHDRQRMDWWQWITLLQGNVIIISF